MMLRVTKTGNFLKLKLFLGVLLLVGLWGWTLQATTLDEPQVRSGETSSDPALSNPEEIPKPEPKEPVSLQLNLPATRLDLYVNGTFKKSFPVSIGMPRYPTPIRDFNISMIIWNPWWIPPDSDWAKNAEKTPPGPGNPLGVVKMLMEDGVRIHGTNKRSSIGHAQSHACVRMFNDDAQEVAWTIQERYSEKTDPDLPLKYKKNRRSSYYVKLFEEVPVEVVYRQVERKGDRLLLHPNPYWRKGFKEDLTDALADHPEVLIDETLVKKLDKMRRKKTVEIPIREVVDWGFPSTQKLSADSHGSGSALNPPAAKALSTQ